MIEIHFYILLSSNVPFAIVLKVYALFLHYVYGITNHKFPVHYKLEIPPFPLMDFGYVILEGPPNLVQVRKILLQFVGGSSTI